MQTAPARPKLPFFASAAYPVLTRKTSIIE
jgi:hypothetical protein